MADFINGYFYFIKDTESSCIEELEKNLKKKACVWIVLRNQVRSGKKLNLL